MYYLPTQACGCQPCRQLQEQLHLEHTPNPNLANRLIFIMVDMPSIPEIYLLLASAMEVAVMRLNGKTFCTRADVAITEPCLKAE